MAFLFLPNILSELSWGWLRCFFANAEFMLNTLGVRNFGRGKFEGESDGVVHWEPAEVARMGCLGVRAGVKIGLGVFASLDEDE